MNDLEALKRAVCDSADGHGYGFQHAVARRIRELSLEPAFRWHDPIMEFPVMAGGSHSRIDLLVRHKYGHRVLVVECKRVNPAFGTWVFFESPPAAGPRPRSSQLVFAEQLHWDEAGTFQRAVLAGQWSETTGRARHLGLVLKRDDTKGDPWSPEGSKKDALEHACSQVTLGLNGFLSFAARNWGEFGGHRFLTLFPVVITTAQLYTCELDLADANLETGSVAAQDVVLEPVDWVIYHFSQGHGLKHTLPLTGLNSETDPLLEALYREFVRPVAIVSPKGLEPFLRLDHWL